MLGRFVIESRKTISPLDPPSIESQHSLSQKQVIRIGITCFALYGTYTFFLRKVCLLLPRKL